MTLLLKLLIVLLTPEPIEEPRSELIPVYKLCYGEEIPVVELTEYKHFYKHSKRRREIIKEYGGFCPIYE